MRLLLRLIPSSLPLETMLVLFFPHPYQNPSRPGMLAGKTPKKEKALPHLMRVLLVPLLLPRAGAMNAIFGEQTTC
jgi:hypothetical protein